MVARGVPAEIWHSRLGHPNSKILSHLQSTGVLSFSKRFSGLCYSCQVAKSKCLPFSDVEHLCTQPLYLVPSDVWSSPVTSNSGFQYSLLFVDDFTRFSWVYPMRSKSEVSFVPLIILFVDLSTKMKILQSDGGREYDNASLKLFINDHGISLRLSCPYTPQQNGVAERKHSRHYSILSMIFNVVLLD